MVIEKNYIEKKIFIQNNNQFKIYSENGFSVSYLYFSYLNFTTKISEINECKFTLDSNLNLTHLQPNKYHRNSESEFKYKINSSIQDTLQFIQHFDEKLLQKKFYISSEFNILNYLYMFVFCSENIHLAKSYFDSISPKYLAQTIYFFSYFFDIFSKNKENYFKNDLKNFESIIINNYIELPFFDLFIEICKEKIEFIPLEEMIKYNFKTIYFLKPLFVDKKYFIIESLYGKFSLEQKETIISGLNIIIDNENFLIQPNQFFNILEENNKHKQIFNIIIEKQNEMLLHFYSILFQNIFKNFDFFRQKFQFNIKYLAKRSLKSEKSEVSLDIFIEKYSFSIYLYFAQVFNTFDFSNKSIYSHFLFFFKYALNPINLEKVSVYHKTCFIKFFTLSKEENIFHKTLEIFSYFNEDFTQYSDFFNNNSYDNTYLFGYLLNKGRIEPDLELDITTLFKNNPLLKKRYIILKTIQKRQDSKKNMITIPANHYKIYLEHYELKKNFDNF